MVGTIEPKQVKRLICFGLVVFKNLLRKQRMSKYFRVKYRCASCFHVNCTYMPFVKTNIFL